MQKKTKLSIEERLHGIYVTTQQVNFKAKTLTRTRVQIDRWIVYNIIFKYRAGVPIEYIALQYETTLAQMHKIVEVGKNTNNKYRKRQMTGLDYVTESFMFFFHLGTPIHIMCRLYKLTPFQVIDFYVDHYPAIEHLRIRSLLRVKKDIPLTYFKTEEGAERLQMIKKMIKWTQ